MADFQVDFLDHVAIRVKDLEVAAQWYERVLGLRRHCPEAWQPFPIFLLAGKTGIALFPANPEHPTLDPTSKNIKIDHFAFQLTPESFSKAQDHYDQLGIKYEIQDHHYFRSIYTKDPDGHTVELTCLQVPQEDFYPSKPT